MGKLLLVFLIFVGVPSAFAKNECQKEVSVSLVRAADKVTVDFFLKNKRLPEFEEISRKLPEVDSDEFDAADSVLKAAASAPELFTSMRFKQLKETSVFFAKRLRLPTTTEFQDLLEWRLPSGLTLELIPLLFGSPEDFFRSLREQHPEMILKAKSKMVQAFLRAMSQKDRPKNLRTQPARPSKEELFQSLVRNNTNTDLQADGLRGAFTLANVTDLVEKTLFKGGMAELEDLARLESPGRFANFRSQEAVSLDRAERMKKALETKAGFLVTSVTSGMPLVEEMLMSMEKYAEDLNYDIIVYPANGQTEGLDQRLWDHPRIHILTHTIQNRFFKLSNIGIMPKNQNPFASLNKHKQFIPGQTVIVGHPQLAHEVLPTSSNHIHQTTLWSTGSLSRNVYPYAYPMQARTSYLAKNAHVNSFLVLEKADADSGLSREGVQNRWHVRPVEFANDAKDVEPGFTDLGQRYIVRGGRVLRQEQNPEALFMGDIHEICADQSFLLAYANLLKRFLPRSISVFLEDPIDNASSNRHEVEKLSILIRKFISGELNMSKELTGLVQFDNALAAIPSVRNRNYKDSNHTYWIKDLLDKRPATHSVINGSIMAELTFARDVLGIREPLEYVLVHRRKFLETLPLPVRRDFEEREVFTSDPQNVRVIPYGEPFVIGPEWRPVHAQNHGHQGTNGAKGSARAHAAGQQRAVSGDSHRSAILGGWVNVGTSTPKKIGYNDGGYSSWTNSAALVYPDGTIQLLTYDSVVGTLFARRESKTLKAADFFGDFALEIMPNDNDEFKGEIYDQFSEWSRRRGSGLN